MDIHEGRPNDGRAKGMFGSYVDVDLLAGKYNRCVSSPCMLYAVCYLQINGLDGRAYCIVLFFSLHILFSLLYLTIVMPEQLYFVLILVLVLIMLLPKHIPTLNQFTSTCWKSVYRYTPRSNENTITLFTQWFVYTHIHPSPHFMGQERENVM